MLEAPLGTDPQHAEPDNTAPRPTAALTLRSQLQRRAHPYGQGISQLLHPAAVQELTLEEKTPET